MQMPYDGIDNRNTSIKVDLACAFERIHALFQEIWDVARKLSCPLLERDSGTTVAFPAITVDMLEAVSVPVDSSGTSVECWMDIRRGTYPQVICKGNKNIG